MWGEYLYSWQYVLVDMALEWGLFACLLAPHYVCQCLPVTCVLQVVPRMFDIPIEYACCLHSCFGH